MKYPTVEKAPAFSFPKSKKLIELVYAKRKIPFYNIENSKNIIKKVIIIRYLFLNLRDSMR